MSDIKTPAAAILATSGQWTLQNPWRYREESGYEIRTDDVEIVGNEWMGNVSLNLITSWLTGEAKVTGVEASSVAKCMDVDALAEFAAAAQAAHEAMCVFTRVLKARGYWQDVEQALFD